MTKSLKMLITVLALTLSATYANAALTIDLDKKLIPINAFYKGNSITISGTVESGRDVVVKVTSPLESESFMVKAKFYHLFWLNKNKIDVTKVNSVYMLFSSGDIDKILSVDEKNKYQLGYEALKQSVGISGGSDRDKLFREFIKVKEDGNLYSVAGNKVILMPSTGGRNSFWLTVDMPYQVPIGSYSIDVYSVKNGVVVEQVADSVKIEPIGLVRKISDMAMGHGGVYGMIAIMIALFAGYTVTPAIALVKKIVVTVPKKFLGLTNNHRLSAVTVFKESEKVKE